MAIPGCFRHMMRSGWCLAMVDCYISCTKTENLQDWGCRKWFTASRGPLRLPLLTLKPFKTCTLLKREGSPATKKCLNIEPSGDLRKPFQTYTPAQKRRFTCYQKMLEYRTLGRLEVAATASLHISIGTFNFESKLISVTDRGDRRVGERNNIVLILLLVANWSL